MLLILGYMQQYQPKILNETFVDKPHEKRGDADVSKNTDPFMITFVFKKEFGSSDITESKTNYTIIDGFTNYWNHVVFKPQGDKDRAKAQENFIKVKTAISN